MEKIIWEMQWEDTILKDNGVSGYYWIKGFADIVKEKGYKVNEVRTIIREKELREKMGNVQEEKKLVLKKLMIMKIIIMIMIFRESFINDISKFPIFGVEKT